MACVTGSRRTLGPSPRAAIGDIGLRILREHFHFLPVAQIHPDKSSLVGVQGGMNDQALTIRREPGDERSADHLPGKERLLERHYNQIAPWFVDRVAHPTIEACSRSSHRRPSPRG